MQTTSSPPGSERFFSALMPQAAWLMGGFLLNDCNSGELLWLHLCTVLLINTGQQANHLLLCSVGFVFYNGNKKLEYNMVSKMENKQSEDSPILFPRSFFIFIHDFYSYSWTFVFDEYQRNRCHRKDQVLLIPAACVHLLDLVWFISVWDSTALEKQIA